MYRYVIGTSKAYSMDFAINDYVVMLIHTNSLTLNNFIKIRDLHLKRYQMLF